MFSTCPATGRMMHNFDKVTHRCKCGRWERGFKPKCEPVRERDECQICERKQALNTNGKLGHHGYTRPGWGFIQGDCMGVGHKPYPETDALELYLIAVRSHIAKCKARLIELPTLDEIEYRDMVYIDNYRKQPRTRILKRGDVANHMPKIGHPGFDYVVKVAIANMENEIAFASKDEIRVVERIEAAKQLTAK